MKYDNNEKNVLIVQKALYSKQLMYYAKLCETYQELANYAVRTYNFTETKGGESIADKVNHRYGQYLAQAAAGNLSFLNNSSQFSLEEARLFNKYSIQAQSISKFLEASTKLAHATYNNNDEFSIDETLLEEYKEFMQSSPATQNFENFIAESPKKWVAHTSFLRSRKALREITQIDPNHLTHLSDRTQTLTPQSFAASLSRPIGYIPSRAFEPTASHLDKVLGPDRSVNDEIEYKKYLDVEKSFKDEFYDTYSDDKEFKTYEKGISPSERLGQAVYKKYHANKGTLQKAARKAAAIAIASGIAFGAISGTSKFIQNRINAHKFNQTSAFTNEENGYEQVISDYTLELLKHNSELIENLKNSPTTPTPEDLYLVRLALDDEIDEVIDDIVRHGFSEQFPNLTIPVDGIETEYDLSKANPEDGEAGNFIYITCYDSEGNKYNYTISKFKSQGKNRLNESFESEKELDKFLNSKIQLANSESYQENAKKVADIIKVLDKIHKETIDLAGATTVFEKAAQIEYDNNAATGKNTFIDNVKANFSDFFIVRPVIKLVTPEKETVQTTKAEQSTTPPEQPSVPETYVFQNPNNHQSDQTSTDARDDR